MSKNTRTAIASIAAIAGSQLAGILVSYTAPGQSSNCLQWASESLSTAQQGIQTHINPAPIVEGTGYYDVRTKRNVPTYPVGHYQASAPAPTAAAAPVAQVENQPIAVAPSFYASPDPLVASQETALNPESATANGLPVGQYQANTEVDRGDAGMGGVYVHE